MGLDMYLHTRTREEVGYWRKANAIHRWFVENVQNGEDDCGEYRVSHEQMQELLDRVNKVLAASKLVKGKVHAYQTLENGEWVEHFIEGQVIHDPSTAQELLPTQSGFFFGVTDYDEYYLEDLKQTKEILETALADQKGDFYYHSSW